MAPEVYRYILGHSSKQSFDPTMADVFSVGLCIVEAASLEPERNYYTADKTFDEGLLRRKIRKLSHVYSKDFINLLCRMLISEPSERIDVYIIIKEAMKSSE